MISIRESVTIAAPLASVWPLLRDPHTVASCIPGAELAPDSGDGIWRGSVRVKFGPTVAIFRGEAKLSFDDETKRCTIEGRGIDQRGASRALSSLAINASGAETTLLDIEGGFSVTGPLGTFANAGGVHVMRALLTEFSANIASAAGWTGASARATASAASATASAGATASAAGATASAADTTEFAADAMPLGQRRAVATPTSSPLTEAVPAASRTSPAVTAPPKSRAFARELTAGRLLRLSFVSWLRSLFRGKNK